MNLARLRAVQCKGSQRTVSFNSLECLEVFFRKMSVRTLVHHLGEVLLYGETLGYKKNNNGQLRFSGQDDSTP